MTIRGISAITLGTHDMARSVDFYRRLGFDVARGGDEASFTTLDAGFSALNLVLVPQDRAISWWGRVIFYVSDVDAAYEQSRCEGLEAEFPPRDAPWGERYFHITDPDGHEVSFAAPL